MRTIIDQHPSIPLPPRAYTAAIFSASSTQDEEFAIQLFDIMQERDKIAPSSWVYANLINALGRAGRLDEALERYEEMKLLHMQITPRTIVGVLEGLFFHKQGAVLRSLLDDMVKYRIRMDRRMFRRLLRLCHRCEDLELGAEVLRFRRLHGGEDAANGLDNVTILSNLKAVVGWAKSQGPGAGDAVLTFLAELLVLEKEDNSRILADAEKVLRQCGLLSRRAELIERLRTLENENDSVAGQAEE